MTILRVVTDERYRRHRSGPGHPERPERVDALLDGLGVAMAERASLGRDIVGPSDLASWLSGAHQPAYIALVQAVCAKLAGEQLAQLPTGDTIVGRESYDIALLAAGAALGAAQVARVGEPVISAMRPPGHHAEPARGMGFCLFNNVAVAAAWARAKLGPVMIVDFDYHHGNGTQAWIDGLSGVGAVAAYLSTHAHPAYPGTGAFSETYVSPERVVVDIPLPHTTNTADFASLWRRLLPVAARRIRPKLILVSAGFDFLAGDPIAGLPVSTEAVGALCSALDAVSREYEAPLCFVLEGGYALENMHAAGHSLAEFFGGAPSTEEAPPGEPSDPRLRRMLTQACALLETT